MYLSIHDRLSICGNLGTRTTMVSEEQEGIWKEMVVE
jgi:hypothetical protein